MRVRLTVMGEKDVATVDLTADEAQVLARALNDVSWYGTKPGETRLPKGVEVAPV